MSRTRTLTAAIGAMAAIGGMLIGSASRPAQASARPAETPLAGSVAPFTSHTQATGSVAGSSRLSVQLWLRPQVAAAQQFASAVTAPGSALFRHYLSPDGYTSRFGPAAGEASKVESWLRAEGFTGVQASPQRSYVRATAAASTIDAAFRTQLQVYRASAAVNAGPYALRANSGPVSLPSSLAGGVLGVTGLDNAGPILPLDYQSAAPGGEPVSPAAATAGPTAPCSQYYGQHLASGLPVHFGETEFPTEVCGYDASQLRAAYGSTTQAAGRGQTIALVELGLTKDMFLTLQDYAAANGMPAPSTQRYTELSLGKGSACGDPFDVEEQLDVESSYDMAPAATQLVVGGDSCNDGDFGLQGLFDADLAVINGSGAHPLASVASNSWEGGDESQAPFLTSIEHAYLLQAAAEGVGMYFSSGDGSGVETPSSDPFAIAVGGTTLGVGETGNRLFETGWSTGVSVLNDGKWVFQGEQGAAGGGPSVLWKEPGYQQGVVPASLARAPGNRGGSVRVVPDISADADPFTGFAVGLLTFRNNKHLPPLFRESDIGGTSLSAPTVAGIVTAAQQGQPGPFGFINPAIYQLAGTSAVFRTLPLSSHSPELYRGTACDAATCGAQALTTFDDQSAAMAGYTGQVTLGGYDNMSGIGTPNGPAFITALRNLEQ